LSRYWQILIFDVTIIGLWLTPVITAFLGNMSSVLNECNCVTEFRGVHVCKQSINKTNNIQYHSWKAPPWSSGSVLDHRSLPPVFESRRGHIWRLFRLWLRLITFGGRSAHLAYHVHKSGRKTSINSIECLKGNDALVWL